MTKTENIIWRRIQEKAERMAYQERPEPLNERIMMCWDAHCYKYIDTAGKINFILSQEEFYKLSWFMGLHQTAHEALNNNYASLSPKAKAIINAIFDNKMPDYKILEALLTVPPFWDDREKKIRE